MKADATPRDLVAEIRKDADKKGYRFTTWERGFLDSVERRSALTEDQKSALLRIEHKLYDTESDEDEEEGRSGGSVDRMWDRHHTRR